MSEDRATMPDPEWRKSYEALRDTHLLALKSLDTLARESGLLPALEEGRPTAKDTWFAIPKEDRERLIREMSERSCDALNVSTDRDYCEPTRAFHAKRHALLEAAIGMLKSDE